MAISIQTGMRGSGGADDTEANIGYEMHVLTACLYFCSPYSAIYESIHGLAAENDA